MSRNPSSSRLEQQLWMTLKKQAVIDTKAPPPSDSLVAHQSMATLLDDPSFLERYHPSWYPSTPVPLSLLPDAHSSTRYVCLRFLRNALLPPKEILLYGLLDHSPFFSLLDFAYLRLEQVVHFLGLHDLAAQLSQVLDKKILITLNQILSTSQQQYLQYCVRQPRRWAPPKWDLARWDRKPATLWAWVFEQGLMRMAKATSTESKSFQWHLIRRFDKKWEPLYTQVMQSTPSENLTHYFRQQLLSLLEQIQ